LAAIALLLAFQHPASSRELSLSELAQLTGAGNGLKCQVVAGCANCVDNPCVGNDQATCEADRATICPGGPHVDCVEGAPFDNCEIPNDDAGHDCKATRECIWMDDGMGMGGGFCLEGTTGIALRAYYQCI
ncbi:MAG: hypothetical protein KDA80_23775, partial [Planctomycetaceae bacterium]|nr:hypothetical protein [Planctomycetaceae bacterium]